MKSLTYKSIELFVLFVVFPMSLIFQWSIVLKFVLGVLGFVYVIAVLLLVEKERLYINKQIKRVAFYKTTLYKFLGIAVLTILFVYITDSNKLFNPIRNDYRVWLFYVAIYVVLSVYPQELIFRTFFFKRYASLIKAQSVFIVVNAALFSLAHLFFGNVFVMIITFIGGLLFAITYNSTKSTFLVFVEHAIYGSWLYTVGMGEMLGFPS